MWFQRFQSTWELWRTPIQQISIKKSQILWWHVLVIQCCSMKYWKQRYVGVDFDHCWPCLSSVALQPCQARSKNTATCVSSQSFPQNSHSPCSAYLQQWWLLKIQGAARTSLIYLLACFMLRVSLKRIRWCAHVDTGTRALICDTSQWTSRDKGFHAGKLSHALYGMLFSQSQTGGFKWQQRSRNNSLYIK